SHTEELVSRSAGIFATDNLLWLYACMAAMKVLHEFGHAFVVKRFGGAVAVNNVSLAAHHLSSQLDVTPC
ncbi:MAG: hypothetical protein NWP37_01560, partial [Pontimonas sp.]|nr:hypothetical protein [Pontimonas sp.]